MFLEFDSSVVKVSWPVYFVLYGVWTIWINHIRCVVASRDIAAGELLLEDYPAVYGPKDQYLGRYQIQSDRISAEKNISYRIFTVWCQILSIYFRQR